MIYSVEPPVEKLFIEPYQFAGENGDKNEGTETEDEYRRRLWQISCNTTLPIEGNIRGKRIYFHNATGARKSKYKKEAKN